MNTWYTPHATLQQCYRLLNKIKYSPVNSMFLCPATGTVVCVFTPHTRAAMQRLWLGRWHMWIIILFPQHAQISRSTSLFFVSLFFILLFFCLLLWPDSWQQILLRSEQRQVPFLKRHLVTVTKTRPTSKKFNYVRSGFEPRTFRSQSRHREL